MEDKAKQLVEVLERLSLVQDSDDTRGFLYELQELQKEIPKDTYLNTLKQMLLQELKKGNQQLVSVVEEIESNILEQEDIKLELIRINSDQKNKGWEV